MFFVSWNHRTGKTRDEPRAVLSPSPDDSGSEKCPPPDSLTADLFGSARLGRNYSEDVARK